MQKYVALLLISATSLLPEIRPVPGYAQAQIANQLAADDPELYYAAMRFIDHVNAESQTGPGAQGSFTLQQALQKQIAVGDADYVVLVEEASRLGSALSTRSSQPLSPSSRTLAIHNTQARINQRLTPEGNAAFHTFVNTFIRGGLKSFTR